MSSEPVYLDCNATTPIDPEVHDLFCQFQAVEFGNSGSRTHELGNRAKQGVQKARDQTAGLVNANRDELLFTSGATESNNLAILGLREFGESTGKKHIISTAIEHKAVLEPLEFLGENGFEIELLESDESGAVNTDHLSKLLRDDTLLVSVMHVNNETGVILPIKDISQTLSSHDAFFHVDAAQGFGKRSEDLKNKRIDLISISGHKIYAPKGIGALVVRRRGFSRIPLKPLFYGGGQERGIRPGTLPVASIVAMGKAAELSNKNADKWQKRNVEIKRDAVQAFESVGGIPNGDQSKVVSTTFNVALPGLDSEAMILALKNTVAISNGSACTSANYTTSHVLEAMKLPEDRIKGSLRLSWCHMTPDPPWNDITKVISNML